MEPVEVRVPARVGLVGNPSDGYGGAVLAAIVDRFAATVSVTPGAAGVRLVAAGTGALEWPSTGAFVADLDERGHPPSQRIVTAALRTAIGHVGEIPAATIEWRTTIPRSVGLAGSSAIAIGVIEAVAASLGATVDPRMVAALALDAEVIELGIGAGWQDRIVQAHRGAVLVDAGACSVVDGRSVPFVRRLAPLGIDVVLGWRSSDAQDSGRYHGALRARTDDRAVAAAMGELAALARQAADVAGVGDVSALAELVDASWRRRCATMPLAPAHAELVEAARAVGAAATSPGSGGSVVAIGADAAMRKATLDALSAVGATAIVTSLR